MRALSAFLLACVLVVPAHAQSAGRTFSMGIRYHLCTNPPSPRCFCFSEKDKKKSCPACQSWVLTTNETPVTVATTRDAYDEDVLPNANYFLKGVSEATYKVKYPTSASGHPVTTSDLFKNFAKYNWGEVEAGQPRKGAIAVWEGGAGVVVSDSGGKVRILYSSAARNGEIREERLVDVAANKIVKFVLPKAYVASLHRE